MIERNVSVGFGSNNTTKVRVSQFDSMWTFVFAIYMDGERWTIPNGLTVQMNGRKPDKNVFAFPGTIVNNTVKVDCDIQMTACAGPTMCELVFLDANEKTVGTANFMLAVEPAPKSPDDVSSESTLPAYAAVLNAVTEDDESVRLAAASAAAAQAVLESIPSDYSTLQEDVDDLKSDLSELTELPFEDGYITNSTEPVDIDNRTVVTGTTWKSAVVSCSAGDKFLINAHGGAAPRTYSFLDSSKMILYVADSQTTFENLSVTAPANTAYLVINDRNGWMSYAVGDIIKSADLKKSIEELDGEVIKVTPQTLTAEQQAQARTNIGVNESGGGLSDEAKEALLNCFYHVVWSDSSGEEYCRILEHALYPGGYPRIVADLDLGSHTVYEGDSLSSLTPYLTVRLYQSESDDGTTIPSTDYTLSGSLVAGTSTVTVTYNDLVTSVNVPVATHVLYQLPETKTFDGTAASDFNTGYNLFATDIDFTVVCTGTINAGTSGQTIIFARDNDNGFALTLEYSYNSSTGYSMYTNSHNNNSHSRGTGALSGSYPFKFAFSHARGASIYTVQIKFNNKNVTERNTTYTYVRGDFPLALGCKYWVSGGAISQYGTPRFNGTITEFKVLDYAMTQAECNQYCA